MQPLLPVLFPLSVSVTCPESSVGAPLQALAADTFCGEVAARLPAEAMGTSAHKARSIAETLGSGIAAASLALGASGAESFLAAEEGLTDGEVGLVIGGLVLFAAAFTGLVAFLRRPPRVIDFTIGRDPGVNGLILPDQTVSSKHAEVRFERKTGRFWIRNTSRTNATVLKRGPTERRVEENFLELQAGDVLRFGLMDIRFLPASVKGVGKEPRLAFEHVATIAAPQQTFVLPHSPVHSGDPWADNRRRIAEAHRQEESRSVPRENVEKENLSRQCAQEAAEIEKAKKFSYVDEPIRRLLDEAAVFLRYRSFALKPVGGATSRVEGVNAAELIRGQGIRLDSLEVEVALAFARAGQSLRIPPFNLVLEMSRVRDLFRAQEDPFARQEAVRLMSQRIQALEAMIGLEVQETGNHVVMSQVLASLRRERDLLVVGRAADLCRDVRGRIVDALVMGYVDAKRRNPVAEKLFQTRLNSRPQPAGVRRGFDDLDDFGSITSGNYLAAAMNEKPFEIADLVSRVLPR